MRPISGSSRTSGDLRLCRLAMVMNKLSKPTRRRILLNTGILAAGWELSCTDAVLTQELAADTCEAALF